MSTRHSSRCLRLSFTWLKTARHAGNRKLVKLRVSVAKFNARSKVTEVVKEAACANKASSVSHHAPLFSSMVPSFGPTNLSAEQ